MLLLPSDNLVSLIKKNLCAQLDRSGVVIFTFTVFMNAGLFYQH